MNKQEYTKFIKDVKEDLEADYGNKKEHILPDVAANLLITEPGLKEYLKRTTKVQNDVILEEILETALL